ncbi:pectate lyase [Morchella snyderi]|nr:pectate lyase [Morchella snyderi]
MQLTSILVSAILGAVSVSAAATTTFPSAASSTTLSSAKTITGTFDGGMKRFGRGVSCTGQAEGGNKDAVFILESGATLKNVIIGKDQIEGVHCLGSCTIQNVWWEDVCEDALTIKQSSGTSYVTGGGAKNADDKVFQHNGGGKLVVKDFYVQDFGKLWRSCGNCKSGQTKRQLELSGVVAKNGKLLAGANENYGDTVTIKSTKVSNVKKICARYTGNSSGAEPKELGSGPDSKVCLYATSDVTSI